ncbi:MAG: hypothetical protein M1833_005784 [Piccolia ochrophora]|nr:MAG: hypothetical protein M1833_005784 [Piccolia ochrophora]
MAFFVFLNLLSLAAALPTPEPTAMPTMTLEDLKGIPACNNGQHTRIQAAFNSMQNMAYLAAISDAPDIYQLLFGPSDTAVVKEQFTTLASFKLPGNVSIVCDTAAQTKPCQSEPNLAYSFVPGQTEPHTAVFCSRWFEWQTSDGCKDPMNPAELGDDEWPRANDVTLLYAFISTLYPQGLKVGSGPWEGNRYGCYTRKCLTNLAKAAQDNPQAPNVTTWVAGSYEFYAAGVRARSHQCAGQQAVLTTEVS